MFFYNNFNYVMHLKVVKSVKRVMKGNDLIPFSEAVDTFTHNNSNCIITDGTVFLDTYVL